MAGAEPMRQVGNELLLGVVEISRIDMPPVPLVQGKNLGCGDRAMGIAVPRDAAEPAKSRRSDGLWARTTMSKMYSFLERGSSRNAVQGGSFEARSVRGMPAAGSGRSQRASHEGR